MTKLEQSTKERSTRKTESNRPKTTVSSRIGLQKLIQANKQALQIIHNR